MTTLLLELAGPQQSWGSRSRFSTRATESAPTRSGVIGLIAAALGIERDGSLERFDALRFGVRIDQPGELEHDFQTTRSLDGSNAFPLSNRYYLADAVFVAGFEGERPELEAYAEAIRTPHYPLYLGRRAFPPSPPIAPRIVEGTLEDAFSTHPWCARPRHRRGMTAPRVTLEVVRDAGIDEPSSRSLADVPRSFDPRRRAYDVRDIVMTTVEIDHPDPPSVPAAAPPREPTPRRQGDPLLGSPTDHDPHLLLADEEV